MDEVYENLSSIMEDFYKSDGAEPYFLLYDISSVYFEGKRVKIAKRGYSRDKRPDRPQVLLGLVLNKRGHPIHFEVLPGNIKDSQTVLDVIKKLKKRFGIKKGIFIGDRGMITSGNLKDIKEEELGYIMALKHEAAKDLLINEEIQPELFDERIPVEISGDGEKKYVLCGSKYRKERDLNVFKSLLDKGKEALGIVERMVNAGRLKKYDKVVRRAQKKLTQTNTERYLDFEYKDGEFKIIELKDNIKRAKNLCGYYILETSELGLEDKEVERNYKKLQDVERVFRDLKNLLDIRPIYHWKDRRVKTHIYLCLIAQSILGKLREQLSEIGWLGEKKDKTLSNFINQLGTIHLGVFKDEFTDETKYKVQSKNPLKQELKDILGFSFFNFKKDKKECCI
jgi:transposase